ncbi:MAG: UNC-like C-terminal-domain-containing protein [Benjaminiella poitrasii]|nr:MAG: UNC-like C-terminal-domain-containing protein [Benjaminiella poitrasii]
MSSSSNLHRQMSNRPDKLNVPNLQNVGSSTEVQSQQETIQRSNSRKTAFGVPLPSHVQFAGASEDENFGEYSEIERLVRNPALEAQLSRLSSQNVPYSPDGPIASRLRRRSSALVSYTAASFSNELESKSASPMFDDASNKALSFILRPFLFMIFGIFWVIKEPIIRVLTLITIIVSAVLIDPVLYIVYQLPALDRSHMPSRESRRKIACVFTALVVTSFLTSLLYWSKPDDMSMQKAAMHYVSSVYIKTGLASHNLSSQQRDGDLSSFDDKFASIESDILDLFEKAKAAQKATDNWDEYRHGLASELRALVKHETNDMVQQLTDRLLTTQPERANLLAEFESLQSYIPDNVLVQADSKGKFALPDQLYDLLRDREAWISYWNQQEAALAEFQARNPAERLPVVSHHKFMVVSKQAFCLFVVNDLALTDNTPTKIADYALGVRGAKVLLSRTSRSYLQPGSFLSALLFPLRHIAANSPTVLLQDQLQVGHCWKMAEDSGHVSILLSEPVVVQGITIEHMSKYVWDQFDSALRDLEVYAEPRYTGLSDTISLGKAMFDINKDMASQSFKMDVYPETPVKAIILKVKSNWGNRDWTELCRIRVHGVPSRLSA